MSYILPLNDKKYKKKFNLLSDADKKIEKIYKEKIINKIYYSPNHDCIKAFFEDDAFSASWDEVMKDLKDETKA